MAGSHIGMRMPDAESLEVVREVIAYESVVRNVPSGRAFVELVLEGADFGSYPEEVRRRLRGIAESSDDDFVRSFIPELADGGGPDG